jgi:UDP-N-acetylmuramate dehydrogenase
MVGCGVTKGDSREIKFQSRLHRPERRAGRYIMTFPDIALELMRTMPRLVGSLTANQPLRKYTSFRAGGPAQVMFRPKHENDLAYFLTRLPLNVDVTVIGRGSNLLVRDGGIPGIVIRLGSGFYELAKESATRLRVGAAVPDVKVAHAAQRLGIGGLSFLCGIPGSVGGTLRMNGGCYGGEIKDVVIEARTVDRNGRIHVFSNEEMEFGYRECKVPPDHIFTQALLNGEVKAPEIILKEIVEIGARRESTQPIREFTGGSTFKNPKGYSAGELIDRVGCKGKSARGVEVSSIHANFLVNRANAAAENIERVGELIRKRVERKTGVALEWEVKRVGIERQIPIAAV